MYTYQLNNSKNLSFLKDIVQKKDSYIQKVNHVMHVAVPPSALSSLKTGIQEILDRKLTKFDAQLDGILVGYDNLAVLGTNGSLNPGYFYIHINIRADFYVFNPKVGCRLTGTVLKASSLSLTCLTNKVFTVLVRVPKHLYKCIGANQQIAFTIDKVDFSSQIPFVKGSLDESSVDVASEATVETPASRTDARFAAADCDLSSSPCGGAGVSSPGRRRSNKRRLPPDHDAADPHPQPPQKRSRRDSSAAAQIQVSAESAPPQELYLPDPKPRQAPSPATQEMSAISRSSRSKVKRQKPTASAVLDDMMADLLG